MSIYLTPQRTDPENSEGNVVAYTSKPPVFDENDYVEVIAQVNGIYKGENAFSKFLEHIYSSFARYILAKSC